MEHRAKNDMNPPFLPHAEGDIQEMLEYLNLSNLDDLFKDIPANLRLKKQLDELPRTHGELEAQKHFSDVMNKNITTRNYLSFLGGGIYNRFIPSTVPAITGRSEFYSSYTPYAPVISQGLLQALVEYHSLVCELAGMEAANSSMYDAATAVGEAALMMVRAKKKNKVAIPEALHPDKRSSLETMLEPKGVQLVEIKYDRKTGLIDRNSFQAALVDPDVAGVYFETPNLFGIFEPVPGELCQQIKERKKLACVGFDPISVALVESPGNYGADIAVTEGQGVGLAQNFGGPLLGVLTIKDDKQLLRQLPGRIIGATKTQKGDKDAYVMTLQTREQHIRREKATSNICTNEALTSVATAVYLVSMGPNGLKNVAENLMSRALYLAEEINSLNGFNVPYIDQFFMQEFPVIIEKESAGFAEFQEFMVKNSVFPGKELDNIEGKPFLVCVSEQHTKKNLDRFVQLLEDFLKE
ncbi:MAG: aminomethyl-transferring glycine dehydrogenase subunit GcvPA [Candidatus Odinarchaeota archaeon]